ncbi:unnamed protein product, partial [Symbiodinium sp. CCMP2456]
MDYWIEIFNRWQAMGSWKPGSAPKIIDAYELQELLSVPMPKTLAWVKLFDPAAYAQHECTRSATDLKKVKFSVPAFLSSGIFMSTTISKRQKIRFLLGIFNENDSQTLEPNEFVQMISSFCYGIAAAFALLDNPCVAPKPSARQQLGKCLFERVVNSACCRLPYQEAKKIKASDTAPLWLIEEWFLSESGDPLSAPFKMLLERFSTRGLEDDPEFFEDNVVELHPEPFVSILTPAINSSRCRHGAESIPRVRKAAGLRFIPYRHRALGESIPPDLWCNRAVRGLDEMERLRGTGQTLAMLKATLPVLWDLKPSLSLFLRKICPNAKPRHLRMFQIWMKELDLIEELRAQSSNFRRMQLYVESYFARPILPARIRQELLEEYENLAYSTREACIMQDALRKRFFDRGSRVTKEDYVAAMCPTEFRHKESSPVVSQVIGQLLSMQVAKVEQALLQKAISNAKYGHTLLTAVATMLDASKERLAVSEFPCHGDFAAQSYKERDGVRSPPGASPDTPLLQPRASSEVQSQAGHNFSDSPGIQESSHSLDEVGAMGQEELEEKPPSVRLKSITSVQSADINAFQKRRPSWGCVLSPSGSFRNVWDLLGVLCLMWDVIMIPLQMFELDFELQVGLDWLSRLEMVFWAVDMLLAFFTGFVDRGILILDLRRIRQHYLLHWFGIDFSILLTDFLLEFAFVESLGEVKAAKFLRLIRLLRIIRLGKLTHVSIFLRDQLKSRVACIQLNLGIVLLCIVLLQHVVACCWHGIASLSADSWLDQHSMRNQRVSFQYATAMRWSLAQLGIGGTEIEAVSYAEAVYSVVVAFVSLISFSTVISSMTSLISSLNKAKVEETDQFWLLRKYLRDKHIAGSLAERITDFLRYAYHTHATQTADRPYILQLLSKPLQGELSFRIYRDSILKISFLAEVAQTVAVHNDSAFHKLASEAVSIIDTGTGDVVFSTYGEAEASYLPLQGTLRYLHGQGEQDTEGHTWIAEMALWTKWLHAGDLLSVNFSRLVCLDSQEFCNSMFTSLELRNRAHLYAKLYLERLRQQRILTDLWLYQEVMTAERQPTHGDEG